jgi:integrase/recombinase XerD
MLSKTSSNSISSHSLTNLETKGNNFFDQKVPSQRKLIEMWLFSKSPASQSAYGKDVADFLTAVQKPILKCTLEDMQNYARSLYNKELKPRSMARKLASVKSLFTFATNLGYLQFDVGKIIRLPRYKDDLANRILEPDQIWKIINTAKEQWQNQQKQLLEKQTQVQNSKTTSFLLKERSVKLAERNYLFLLTSYKLGARVSEVINLNFSDFSKAQNGWVCTLFGKGGKTRNVLISFDLYDQLSKLKTSNDPKEFVFKSNKQKNGQKVSLTRQQAFKIVQKATIDAGFGDKNVSPHWFRHSHASHALENGASMPLIQRDLGHSSLATTGKYLHIKPNEGSGLWI